MIPVILKNADWRMVFGPSPETDFCSDLGSVDDIEGDVLLSDDGLHIVRNPLQGLLLVPDAVEQEGAVLLDAFEHIVLVQI